MESITSLTSAEIEQIPGRKIAKTGRKPSITRSKVTKLLEVLESGGSVEDACVFAKISKPTFYRELKANERFETQIAIAKNKVKMKAITNITEQIDKGSPDFAMWWLEHRHAKEFSKSPDVAVQVNNFTVDFVEHDTDDLENLG